METIWRVQDEYGQGCYQAHLPELETMYNKHAYTYFKRPRPIDDRYIGRDIDCKEICGFMTEKQAHKWFTKKELIKLKKFGFELKEVEVKEITIAGEVRNQQRLRKVIIRRR